MAQLRKETGRIEIENKNLRMLNQEMVVLFEREILKFEVQRLVRQNPVLERFRGVLYKCKSIPSLQETASAFLNAIKESTPDHRKGGEGNLSEDDLVGTSSASEDIELPPMRLEESDWDGEPEDVVPDGRDEDGSDIFQKLKARRAMGNR